MILGPHGQPVSSLAPAAPRPVKNFVTDPFEAAKRSGYRGWFYFPTLEPGEMMPREARSVIIGKAWWLYNNVDFVRAIVDGLAVEEVDTGIWPKAATSSARFNKAVNDLFDVECGRPDHFHTAEEESFYSAQVLIRRTIRVVGELFAQLMEPRDGGMPALHFVNAWQCANAKTDLDQSKWTDGVMYNRLKRALKFRFLTNRDGTAWVDSPREATLHFHDQFWTGQLRGMSGLAPIARKLFRLEDIQKAEESGMLLRTRLAYAITKKESDGDGPSIIPGATETETLENADGTKLVVQKISAGDTDVDVADLPLGYDFKVVESNRATQTPEWLRWMLTGCALSTGYPAEHVFGFAGLGNGTDVRRVQKRVQRMKNAVRNFQLIKQFVPYWYEFWLWQRIKAGAFAQVEGGIPADFLRHKYIMPADDSVDVGREGRLYDDRMATGRISPSAYFGMQETDPDDVDDEWIALRESRELKLAALNTKRAQMEPPLPPLRYEDIWPRTQNVQMPPTPSEPHDPAQP